MCTAFYFLKMENIFLQHFFLYKNTPEKTKTYSIMFYGPSRRPPSLKKLLLMKLKKYG